MSHRREPYGEGPRAADLTTEQRLYFMDNTKRLIRKDYGTTTVFCKYHDLKYGIFTATRCRVLSEPKIVKLSWMLEVAKMLKTPLETLIVHAVDDISLAEIERQRINDNRATIYTEDQREHFLDAVEVAVKRQYGTYKTFCAKYNYHSGTFSKYRQRLRETPRDIKVTWMMQVAKDLKLNMEDMING